MSLIDREIYDLCLRHHREVAGLDFVVPNSLPIPYFGDLESYSKSSLKVLTAALNPSSREFPDGKPRFEIAHGLRGADELETELSAYFKNNPYRSWFHSFEPVLNGLGATYGGEMANGDYRHIALHLDMCSPIATSPTWSKLTDDKRAELTNVGQEVFERLIDALKPDIVIASLGWHHIKGWNADFRAGPRWQRILSYEKTFDGSSRLRVPLLVRTRTLQCENGHSYVFANGTAADKPFGRFHNDRKREAGLALLASVGAGQL